MAIGNLEVVIQRENHLQRWIFHFHVIGDDGSKAWVCDRPQMYKPRRISSGGAWTADGWNHQKQNCKSTTWSHDSHDTASSAFKYRESQVAKSWSAWASPPELWTHPASAARGPAISWSVRPRILKVFSFALIDAAYTYIRTYIYIHVYICIYICIYVCTYVYMYVYIYVCTYVRVYIYIHV